MVKKIFDIQERIQTEKKRRRTLGDVNYFFCREKKNIHICLNPILTPEEERKSVAARQGALRVDQVLFR